VTDTADLVVSLFMAGMAIAFVAADPRSPSSRALALALGLGAFSFSLNVLGQPLFRGGAVALGSRVFGISEVATLVASFEWLLRVRRTAGASSKGGNLLRAAQGSILLYGVLSLLFPEMRAYDFLGVESPALGAHWRSELLRRPGFYVFAVPFYGSLILAGVSIHDLVRSKPDPVELVRFRALALATPFLFSGMAVGSNLRSVTTAMGAAIFLIGAIRYHVQQGERGQFLARFLSPQVAELVRERGLASAMEHRRSQISVVSCDLRGFTSFSETAAPEDVLSLLRDYHEAVSRAVSAFGGTIKDFAGDGILTLVGAPIFFPDHAERAVRMALRMRENAAEVLGRWKTLGLEIGLGIGVATGYVTVGVTGGDERLEYAAVGPAVNLASRLCSRADSGQILVDQRTVGLVEKTESSVFRFEKLESVELKGLLRPITIYGVTSGVSHVPREAAHLRMS
jgi:adenylate cyclase